MKKTLRLAKLELSILFYSPIAWFLLIVFIFQCGLIYTSNLETYLTMQDLGTYNGSLVFLTSQLFAPIGGLFAQIVAKLYLYIPLLTMGLISREINGGTVSLLYSSPVRIRQIVFSKFIAMMIYDFVLIIILFFFVCLGMANIKSADIGLLLSGLSGIYILLCTYSAIGLFMSSLTGYQVVAAISTFVMFAVLAYVGTVWQDIDFVRDVTYFLSISGRTNHMLFGLIGTSDIFYFLLIICLFLYLSILKLQSSRETKPWYFKVSKCACIVIFALIVGYISSRPKFIGYWDTTATKSNTLTPNTQAIIKELDSPLEIISYINLLDNHYWYGRPSQHNTDLNRWEPYLRFKSDIKLNYVYYYDSLFSKGFYDYYKNKSLRQIAQNFAKSFKTDINMFKTPAEVHKEIDLRPEGNRYVMSLKYKGKTTFLRLFNDPAVFPSETEVSAALKRLTEKLPKIGFLTGNLERSPGKLGDRDYGILAGEKTFRYALINQGFDIDTVSSDAATIPSGLTALVIADPKTAFSPRVFALLQGYIAKGGNLLIMGEPDKQGILNPLLKILGVQLLDGQLVQRSKDFASDLVLPYLTKHAGYFSKALQQAFEDSMQVSMPGVTGLSYRDTEGFDIQPLLMTDSRVSWLKKAKLVLDSGTAVFSAQQGDIKGPFPTALALRRQINGMEQRIIVTGDADLMNNAELGRFNIRTANFKFNTALFGWFTEGQFPVDTTRPKSKDNRLKLSDSGLAALKIVLLWILPAVLLIFGSVLLIRRKRK